MTSFVLTDRTLRPHPAPALGEWFGAEKHTTGSPNHTFLMFQSIHNRVLSISGMSKDVSRVNNNHNSLPGQTHHFTGSVPHSILASQRRWDTTRPSSTSHSLFHRPRTSTPSRRCGRVPKHAALASSIGTALSGIPYPSKVRVRGLFGSWVLPPNSGSKNGVVSSKMDQKGVIGGPCRSTMLQADLLNSLRGEE